MPEKKSPLTTILTVAALGFAVWAIWRQPEPRELQRRFREEAQRKGEIPLDGLRRKRSRRSRRRA